MCQHRTRQVYLSLATDVSSRGRVDYELCGPYDSIDSWCAVTTHEFTVYLAVNTGYIHRAAGRGDEFVPLRRSVLRSKSIRSVCCLKPCTSIAIDAATTRDQLSVILTKLFNSRPSADSASMVPGSRCFFGTAPQYFPSFLGFPAVSVRPGLEGQGVLWGPLLNVLCDIQVSGKARRDGRVWHATSGCNEFALDTLNLRVDQYLFSSALCTYAR